MRRIVFCWVAFCLSCSIGCQQKAQEAGGHSGPHERIIARAHFKGFDLLAGSTNALTLQEIWKAPETATLRAMAMEKAAPGILGALLKRPAQPDDQAPGRALLESALHYESVFEMVERAGRSPAWAIAVRLPAERRAQWLEDAGKLVRRANTNAGIFAVISTTNSWGVIGFDSAGGGEGRINIPLWQQAQSLPATSLGAHWLRADGNGAALAETFPALAKLGFPSFALSTETQGQGLRSEVRFHSETPRQWALDNWDLPTNTIRDPLISFTAVRGIGRWLKDQEWFRQFGLDGVPNQAVAWGQSDTPFQIQFAFPVENATNALDRIARTWVPSFNRVLADSPLEPVSVNTNAAQISGRLMFLAPFIRRAPEPHREYLNGGIFPLALPGTNAPPAALFEQLNRTNLVYYDWEITQYRIQQLRETLDIVSAVLTLPAMPPTSVARHWIDAIAPRLGNTITEIIATSPTDLTLVRRSHIGFNGLELIALANWIESAGFPKVDTSVGFRPAPSGREGRVPTPPSP